MQYFTGIRSKVTLPLISGMLVLTFSLPLLTYFYAKKAVLNAASSLAVSKVDQVVSAINSMFRAQLQQVQNIAFDAHVANLFQPTVTPEVLFNSANWLKYLLSSSTNYRSIAIVDRAGKVLAASNDLLVGQNLKDSNEAVAQALDGEIVLSNMQFGKVSKQLSATITCSIDINMAVVGALIVNCDFPKLVSDEHNDTIVISALDRVGSFALHPDADLIGNDEDIYPELYAEVENVGYDGRMVRYPILDQYYLGFARVEPISQWVIIASGLERDILAPAYRMGLVVFGISLVVFVVVISVVLYVLHGIIFDLFDLVKFAEKIAGGNLQIKSPRGTVLSRKDEIGRLGNSLSKMASTMTAMINKAVENSKMKSEFLANMSHEIRTPINAVIGMVALSVRDPEITPKVRGYLEKIQMAARSLLGVINDILDISKIEAGKLELESRPFRIHQTLENTFAIHQINAGNRGLSLTLHIDQSLPEVVVGDSLRIGQVLNNLLSNALKFTQHGGVRIECKVLDKNEDGVLFEVNVIDSGIGISDEGIERLFQPFSQADSSITRKFGGTGLGLAISLSLMEMMPEGGLSATSEAGKGSTFTLKVRLPVDTEHQFESTNLMPTEEDFATLGVEGKVVLIAEDNFINQEILSDLIAPSKVEIVIANNGKEAVDVVFSRKVDLVFMDMQMPVMDGLQATKEIRHTMSSALLPIVALSANAMTEHKSEGFAAGMNDYLTKPIELNELFEVMRKYLQV